MANIFENTQLVVNDAGIEFAGALGATALMPGTIQQEFAKKVGETITVSTVPVAEAAMHTGSGPFNSTDINEDSVDITIAGRPYIKHTLTAQELTYELDDFTRLVTRPAMISLAKFVDRFLVHNILVPGFARNVAGTEGTEPSALTDLSAAWKLLFDSELDPAGSTGVITSAAAANLIILDQFTNLDFGEEKPMGLRQAVLAQIYNMNLFPSTSCNTQALGDTAGTVLTNGAPVLGAFTLAIDGFTNVVGELWKGVRFTVAGDTQVYTVTSETADNVYVAGGVTIGIYPAVSADLVTAADGAALTFKTAMTENPVFHPDATAKAVIAPAPQRGNPSAVGVFEGISIRATFESTINNDDTGDAEYVLFDTFVGGQVINPEAGIILQG